MDNKSFSLKQLTQQKYITFGFYRCDAKVYQDNLINNPFLFLNKETRELGLEFRNFLCWGHSDILTIFLFESLERFVDFQKICPSNNKIYEDSYTSGFLIQPKDFTDLSKVEKFPLIGISFIKLTDKLFYAVKEGNTFSLIENTIYDRIQMLIKNKTNIFPVLIFSYGWEDLVLLTFSNRYDEIKKLIFGLRKDLKFSEIASFLEPDFLANNPNIRHLITTTYTVFATHIPFPEDPKKTLDDLNKKIEVADKMLVEKINFQVRPGHLDYPIDKIKELNKTFDFQFIPGKFDFSLKFKSMTTHQLFKFYFESLWPFLKNDENPILATQTFFQLDDEKEVLEECIPCTNPINKISLSDEKKNFIRNIILTSTFLPSHSRIGLANVLVGSWYLKNSFFTEGIMKSFVKFVEAMENGIKNNASLAQASENIFPPLSLSFIDRFRGAYPLGESFSMPLINYKGSFQKQLLFVDYCSFILFDSIRECLNSQGENIEKHYFLSFIGTNFSPAIIAFNVGENKYNLGILQIPIDSFFSPGELYYLFHELGHMILYALDFDIYIYEQLAPALDQLKADGRVIFEARRQANKLILEILSDYILLIFGFEGDCDAFEKFNLTYVGKLYQSEYEETKFRTRVVRSICLYLSDKQKLLTELESLKTDVENRDWAGWPILAINLLSDEIDKNLNIFDFISKISNFFALKGKISSYPLLKNISSYFNSSLMKDWLEIYRGYFADRNF